MALCDKCNTREATHNTEFKFGMLLSVCVPCAREITHAVDTHPRCRDFMRQFHLCEALNFHLQLDTFDAGVYADAMLKLHDMDVELQAFVMDWLSKPKEAVG